MVRGSRFSLARALAIGLVAAKASAEGKALKSHEHVTERAGVKIALYEKWAPGEEAKWKQNGKVVLLVHGATWSGRCTFDPAPGYSMMDAFAEAGYDVFAIDLHGYGKSGKTDRDNTGAASAALDLDAAVDYIRAYRWVEKVHVFGYQWGAQSAALFATAKPNKVGKLVLFGMRFNVVERKGLPEGPFRLNGMSNAMMKPDDGDLDPDFVRKRASICLAADPQSPNGPLVDLTRASPVDPLKIRNSTLVIMGDREVSDQTAFQDRLDFYKSLASRSRWFAIVPGVGKYAPMEKQHARFEAAIVQFLDVPYP